MNRLFKTRSIFRFVSACAALIICLVVGTAAGIGTDFLKQLGLSEQEADDHIQKGFLSGYVNTHALQTARKIPLADHPVVVVAAIQYARKQTENTSFKAAYEKMRQQQKPREVDLPLTPDSFRQSNIHNAEKALTEVETALKNASGDMKVMMQDLVRMAKETLNEAKNPANGYVQLYKNNYQALLKEARDRQTTSLAEWNQKFPEAVPDFIRMRLEQFMRDTDGIDFDAKTQQRNGRKIFVEPAYEHKSRNWKLGYRIGSGAIQAARKSIQSWLNALE